MGDQLMQAGHMDSVGTRHAPHHIVGAVAHRHIELAIYATKVDVRVAWQVIMISVTVQRWIPHSNDSTSRCGVLMEHLTNRKNLVSGKVSSPSMAIRTM